MGLDYKLLFVVGTEVEVSEIEEQKHIPRFDEHTGQRLQDKTIEITSLKAHNFKPVVVKYWRNNFDKETIPELKDFILFFNKSLIGKIVHESEWYDGGNQIIEEIPDYKDKLALIDQELKEMGIEGSVKLYAILDTSF